MLKQRKYMDVCVPSSVDESSGYHMNSYELLWTKTRSSTGASFISTTSGVFVKQCIFCKKKNKKFKEAKQALIMASTENVKKNIKRYAEILKDEDILRLILDEDFVSKEMCYHSVCRVEYQNRAKLVSNRSIKTGEGQQNGQDESWQHFSRRIHNEAFKALSATIDIQIIEDEEVFLTKDLSTQYNALLLEIGSDEFENSSALQKLETKLKQMYGDKISIEQGETKRGKIVFNSKTRLQDALWKENDIKRRLEIQLRDVVLALREELRKQSPQKLPENLKIAAIFQGEVNVPDNLHLFLNYLISRPDPRKQSSSNKQRRINLIGENIIYAISSGAKIPAKHLQVGLAMKSLTGNRKVIEVLDRLGHSISYSVVEEIETELTFEG